jgi:hypothetical protein
MEHKLKHLEFIQSAISRMATNSFLFKGWAITVAAALSGFAAVDTKAGLLLIAIVSTLLFWGLDAYYLWLERGFIELHKTVAAIKQDDQIDFAMAPLTKDGWKGWLRVWVRPHLLFFYGSIVIVDLVAIGFINGAAHHGH